MINKKHSAGALITGLVTLFGFSMMVIFVVSQRITSFDSTVIAFIQGFETSTLTSIMKFFTFIGSFSAMLVIVLVTTLFLYVVLKHRVEIILLWTVVFTTPILNWILKQSFHRARPELHRLIDIGGYSFPSGHAMSAFAFYGILAFLLWRHIPNRSGRTILILFSSLFIILIGISRVYLGVHYPSDIIGGYFASGFWLTIIVWVFQKYKENQYEKDQTAKREGL
ncbi:phosphatase PAP2 family protein [Oceanobacillus arenosus]|uniref:Phosphatase PAP2 family protein n=1 Tax=Oceanobacillus arenosus TaxID=1229153 RepID=A0A3D8Q1K5_9BACI|nr:phosphatase PAP2 family protein [Oceanobacillus arenosus]RDW22316.1 phosphatase PAP2 family protein [Oceanobacillus arenosus]